MLHSRYPRLGCVAGRARQAAHNQHAWPWQMHARYHSTVSHSRQRCTPSSPSLSYILRSRVSVRMACARLMSSKMRACASRCDGVALSGWYRNASRRYILHVRTERVNVALAELPASSRPCPAAAPARPGSRDLPVRRSDTRGIDTRTLAVQCQRGDAGIASATTMRASARRHALFQVRVARRGRSAQNRIEVAGRGCSTRKQPHTHPGRQRRCSGGPHPYPPGHARLQRLCQRAKVPSRTGSGS